MTSILPVAGAIPEFELHIIKGMGHNFSDRFVDQLADMVAKNAGRMKWC